MRRKLNKKVQLEILDEVDNIILSRTPVEIDIDDARWDDFVFLRDKKKCFVYSTRVERETKHLPGGKTIEYAPIESLRYISGLSDEGKAYRDELIIEVAEEQRKDKQIELSEQKVWIAKAALIVSGVATLIALFSLVVAFLAYLK